MQPLSRNTGNPALPGEAPELSQPAGAELRAAPRFTLLIRAAKLVGPMGEYLCVVRDASETGVSIRLFHALPDGAGLVLEMQNGDRFEVDVVWQDQDRAGLRFRAAADIARIIEMPSRFGRRPVRVTLQRAARLASDEETSEVRLVDISQQGAKVAGDRHLAIGQHVRLAARGLPEVNARVRWRRGGFYGLVFADTFQFGDLARIVAAMQAGSPVLR